MRNRLQHSKHYTRSFEETNNPLIILETEQAGPSSVLVVDSRHELNSPQSADDDVDDPDYAPSSDSEEMEENAEKENNENFQCTAEFQYAFNETSS